METYRRFAMRSTAAAAVALLGGCALSSPYVKLPAEPDICTADASCGTLEKAINYSRDVRGRYRDTLDQYAKLRSNSGAAAITLGTAALGAALGSANRDVFTSLGVLGAATYGYASWYGNAPREALFGQTIEALVCAEGATIKLRFPPSARTQAGELTPEATAASAALDTAALALAKAKSDIDAYVAGKRALVDSAPNAGARASAVATRDGAINELKPYQDAAAAALGTVPGAQAALSDALSALAARERAADNAGYALISAVDRIVAATDVEAQKTLPDPSAAFAIIAGLGGTAQKFIPSTDAVTALRDAADKLKPVAEAGHTLHGQLRDEVESLLNRLAAAQQQFVAAASRLTRITKLLTDLAALPSADAVSAVDKCTIAGVGTMSAVPSSVEITAAQDATVSVDMQGGKTPYRVEWSGTAPTGISFSQPGFADSRFVVTGTTTSAAGSSKLKVTDGSGRLLEMAVTAKAK